MKLHRIAGLLMAAAFAAVGLTFLLFPGGVLAFFNRLSPYAGLPPAPVQGAGFYLILASGYMYLVTLLAWSMFRCPENGLFPWLLAQAKLASSALSFGFFAVHRPYLIYLTNGMIDGLLGVVALCFHLRLRRSGPPR